MAALEVCAVRGRVVLIGYLPAMDDLERVRDFKFGLQAANFLSLFVKIFAVGARLRLQILPSLKENLLAFATNPNPEHALRLIWV